MKVKTKCLGDANVQSLSRFRLRALCLIITRIFASHGETVHVLSDDCLVSWSLHMLRQIEVSEAWELKDILRL